MEKLLFIVQGSLRPAVQWPVQVVISGKHFLNAPVIVLSQRQPVRRQFPGKNHEAGAMCPVRKAPVDLGSHFSLLTAPGVSVQILVTTSDAAVARQPLLGPAGSWTPNRLMPHVTQLSYQLKNQ